MSKDKILLEIKEVKKLQQEILELLKLYGFIKYE